MKKIYEVSICNDVDGYYSSNTELDIVLVTDDKDKAYNYLHKARKVLKMAESHVEEQFDKGYEECFLSEVEFENISIHISSFTIN